MQPKELYVGFGLPLTSWPVIYFNFSCLLFLCLWQDQEVFIDTLNTPTYRKKLKKLSVQDPAESRSCWQHVTRALRVPDVEAATDAKHLVRIITTPASSIAAYGL